MPNNESDKPRADIYRGIAYAAIFSKLKTLNADSKYDFDITGVSFIGEKDRKIVFPNDIKGLSFNPAKLLSAIMGGDFMELGQPALSVLYPMVERMGGEEIGDLVGSVHFRMNIEDAAKIVKKCGVILGISEKELIWAIICLDNLIERLTNDQKLRFTYNARRELRKVLTPKDQKEPKT